MMRARRKRAPANPSRKILVALVSALFAAPLAFGNPVGPAVVSGAASFSTTARMLTVANTPSAILNWQGFSIARDETTRFVQQSAASAVLNRVVGQDPSAILGTLSSNGRVFLLNPNGIVFGQGSVVNVAGLVASTLNLSDADFLAGRLNFQAGAIASSIINHGAITTPSGGQVYLIAPNVENHGVISTPQGQTILAAGKSVQLVEADVPNLRVEVQAGGEALNVGQILAEGGSAGIYAGLINHRGIVRADTVEAGKNGTIHFRASKNITLEPGSLVSASGAPGGVHDGGTVRIVAEDTLDMQRGSAVRVDGGVDGGNGGFLELSGKQKIALNGEFTGRALKAGYRNGSLLLDPLNINVVAANVVIATVTAGTNPAKVAVTPDGSRLYVANYGSSPGSADGSVSVIDTATNTVIATVPFSGNPQAVAVTPNGAYVYVGHDSINNVSVIRTSDNVVVATVGVGQGGKTIAFTPDGTRAYVTNHVSNSVSVLDTSIPAIPTLLATVSVGGNPIGAAATATKVYVANRASNTVSVINIVADANTVTNVTIPGTNPGPAELGVMPDGSKVYVANQFNSTISVISTASDTVTSTFAAGGTGPHGVAFTADGSRVYVTNNGSNTVSVLETAGNSLIATVNVGAGPSGIAIGTNPNRVYVADVAVPVIAVAQASTVGGVIAAGDSPGATLDIAPSALNGSWSTVSLAALNNMSVLSPIGNADINNGVGGGSLNLSAGNDIFISAPIGTSSTRFDHNLSLNAGNNININSNIYLGNRTLTLAADATIPSVGVTDGVGDVIIFNPALGGSFSHFNDFNVASNPTPGGIWTYGFMTTLGGALTLYNLTPSSGGIGSWRHSVVQVLEAPAVWQVGFHPGLNNEYSVIRFTAPAAGNYNLSAAFNRSISTSATTDVHIRSGATSLFSGNINGATPNQPFSSTLTLAAGQTVDFAVGFGNDNFLSDSTGVSVTLTGSAPPMTVETLGAINVSGRNFNVQTTGGPVTVGAGTALTANASNSIILNSGVNITSTGGALNVTLNADSDANGAGAIVVGGGGPLTTINSNGGNILLGGGTGASGFAVAEGPNPYGIYLNGAALSSGAGSITLRGQGSRGISMQTGSGSSIQSTTGAISLTGTGSGPGIRISQLQTITSSGGNIQLEGTATGAGKGIEMWGQVSTTGAGTVTLTGSGSTGGIEVANGGIVGDAASASTITLRADSPGPDSIVIVGAQLRGTGQLFLEPVNPASTIGLGGGAGQFNLTSAELGQIQNGFSQLTIGHPTGTGLITVGTHTFNDPIIIRNTGTGSAGIVSSGTLDTGANDLSLLSAGNVNVTQGAVSGANIGINAGSLVVQPGVSASSSSLVNAAGNLTVNANTVQVRGSDTSAGLTAKLQAAGAIDITAGSVSIEGGDANNASAAIDPAGITINATGNVTLQGGIGNEAYALLLSPAGNIALTAGGTISLQQGTGLNANAGIVAEAGMVTMTAPACVGCGGLSVNPWTGSQLLQSGVYGSGGFSFQTPPATAALPAPPPPDIPPPPIIDEIPPPPPIIDEILVLPLLIIVEIPVPPPPPQVLPPPQQQAGAPPVLEPESERQSGSATGSAEGTTPVDDGAGARRRRAPRC